MFSINNIKSSIVIAIIGITFSCKSAHQSNQNNNATSGQQQQQQQQETLMMIHEREFVSPLVKIQMECKRDKTIIRLNFTQPFNGISSAGKLDSSECKLFGNGTKQYELQVQHNSTNCDTQWDNQSNSIFNTLFIRFHNSLETGSDIAKNVMCRLTVGDLIVGKRPQTNRNNHKANSLLPPDLLSDSINIEASVAPPIFNLHKPAATINDANNRR